MIDSRFSGFRLLKNQKFQGILCIICAGFFFSLMSLFVRLSGDVPTMQKAFFRNLITVFVSLAMLLASKDKFRIKKGSWGSLLMRSIFGCLGILCNFYAIGKMGLADANMLNKLSPFFAILFSALLIREKASAVEWITVAAAFGGSLLIIKPSFTMSAVYGLIGLAGGLCAGMAYTFVRKLGKNGERGPVIVFFFSMFTCVACAPAIVLDYQPMNWMQLLYLLLAGAAASGGQLFITAAYTRAPAKEISVFDYTQILFAALFGWLAFGELPDWMSVAGYAVIISVAVIKWRYLLKKEKSGSVSVH